MRKNFYRQAQKGICIATLSATVLTSIPTVSYAEAYAKGRAVMEEMQKLSLRAQAAGAMTLPAVPPQASRTQPADMDAFAAVMVKALKDAGLTVQMDAKTVGYLTAPAVGKQLGFDAKRGKRN